MCLKPISYEEMRIRHSISNQETQSVINKSYFKNRECISLKDFFVSEPNEFDLLSKSNEVILPKIIDSSLSSTKLVKVSSVKKDDEINRKRRTQSGRNSIFVEAFQELRTFSPRPKLNYYDDVEKRIVKPSVMLKAHLSCRMQAVELPRKITNKDKTVKFDKKFRDRFKQKYAVFGYNLYLEENISKNASNKEVRKAKESLWKKYAKESREFMRENLFQNQCVIRSEECKYENTNNFVTIYYDVLTDLFAIVDQKSNYLIDFGIATEVKYAEFFAYKSSGSVKATDICLSPSQKLEETLLGNSSTESTKSKEPEVAEEEYTLSFDDAIAILEERYGSNFVSVENGEFQIQYWQAVKKLEHAVCFGINLADHDFSLNQAVKINRGKGGLVTYVREGNKLPSLDLIRIYQNAIKKFCEDRTQSSRNNVSTFRGQPFVTFFNKETRLAVIFDRQTKIFITAYNLAERNVDEYLIKGNIRENIS